MYIKEKGQPAKDLVLKVPALYRLALDKWRVDEAYEKTVVAGVDALADTAASVDQGVVDFVLARVTSLLVAAFGTILRVAQNGVVHLYAAVMVVGMVALGWFFVAPHPDVTVSENPATGDYVVTASPGPGYGYRWFSGTDLTKDPSPKDFTKEPQQLKVTLKEGETKIVRLEVENAFHSTSTKDVKLTRPKADPTKPEKAQQIQLGER
jgi:hypothetical protein